MAEAIAILSLISSIAQVIDFSARVVERLDKFMTNMKDLPQCFQHMSNQLPIVVDVTKHLQRRVSSGEFSSDTQKDLERVIRALDKELEALDSLLNSILPSEQASTWEKSVKAIKSIKAQKDAESHSSVIQDYLNSLNAFQIVHSSRQIKTLLDFFETRKAETQGPISSLARKPLWTLPFDSDESFIGRKEIMDEIDRRFKTEADRLAIVGIGGVGKSWIAIEYCHQQRRRETEEDIFWVHRSSRAKFEAAYRRIARLVDVPDHEDEEVDFLELVRDHLSHNTRNPWFMVLDSADDYNLWLKSGSPSEKSSRALIYYLPRGLHGKILVTTRDNQLGFRLTEGKHEPIHVARFGSKEASELLRAKILNGRALGNEDAEELTAALEHLPLTITQAAAYLNQIEITAAEYLSAFGAGLSDISELLEESIDDPGRDRETSNSVFQTWRLSFEQISKQNPRATEILCLMAMLDRQGIPQNLLERGKESPIQFKATVAKLKAFSFIVEEKERSRYSLHRLVQLSTWRWIELRGKLLFFKEMALSAVSSRCPQRTEFETWPLFADLRPHINIVLEYDVRTNLALVDRALVLHCFGHYLMQQGQENLALQYFNNARTLRATHLGPEHEDTLRTMMLLGTCYQKLGRTFWNEARQIQRDVVEKSQRVLGANHRLNIESSSRLAILEDPVRCRELQTELLKRKEQELGLEDPATLTEMSNLLYTLSNLKQWQEAEEVGQLALRLRTKVLGSTHPDTITIMALLSYVYKKQHQWIEAAELEERVLFLRLQALGQDHPKSLQAMISLASTFRKQNRHADAVELQRHVVNIRIKNLGSEHEDTVNALRTLNKWSHELGIEPSSATPKNPRNDYVEGNREALPIRPRPLS